MPRCFQCSGDHHFLSCDELSQSLKNFFLKTAGKLDLLRELLNLPKRPNRNRTRRKRSIKSGPDQPRFPSPSSSSIMKDGENQENSKNSISGDHDIIMDSEKNITENTNEEKVSNSQKHIEEKIENENLKNTEESLPTDSELDENSENDEKSSTEWKPVETRATRRKNRKKFQKERLENMVIEELSNSSSPKESGIVLSKSFSQIKEESTNIFKSTNKISGKFFFFGNVSIQGFQTTTFQAPPIKYDPPCCV